MTIIERIENNVGPRAVRRGVLLGLAAWALLVPLSASAQPAPGYQDMVHSSVTGTFRAAVPASYGVVDTFEMDQPSPVGNVHATGHQVASDFLMPNLLALYHYQAPEGFEQGRTTDQVLMDTLTGMVSGLGGTIIAQRAVTMGTYPGIEAEFSALFEGLSLVGKVRIYRIANEAVGVYFVGMTSPTLTDQAILTNPIGLAFLDSLSYLPHTP